MFWIVRISVVLVLVALLLLGLGYLLPAERNTTKTTLIDAPPEQVYDIVTNVAKQAEWRSDLKKLTVHGEGALRSWHEEHESGLSVSLQEKSKVPLKEYEIAFDAGNGIVGTVTGRFEPSNENRTKLTVSEKVLVENPLKRVVCYITLNLDTMLDEYLGDLNRYASKQQEKQKESL